MESGLCVYFLVAIMQIKHVNGSFLHQNQNPKSLLGAIELYLSYFGWTLACYQDPENMQQRMPFALWHQCYVGDLQVLEKEKDK